MNSRIKTFSVAALAMTLSIFSTGCATQPTGTQTAGLPGFPPLFSGQTTGPLGGFTPGARTAITPGAPARVVTGDPADAANNGGAALSDSYAGQLFGDYYGALNRRREAEAALGTEDLSLDAGRHLATLRAAEESALQDWTNFRDMDRAGSLGVAP